MTAPRNRNLVRRVSNESQQMPSPYMAVEPVNLDRQGPPIQRRSGPHSPRVQAYYGRGDGSYHTSHTSSPEVERKLSLCSFVKRLT